MEFWIFTSRLMWSGVLCRKNNNLGKSQSRAKNNYTTVQSKFFNHIAFYCCNLPGRNGDGPSFDVIDCSFISSINLGMFASRISIIASLAGDMVQSFRVIKQISRVSSGSIRIRETKLVSFRGMTREGRTAIPRFAFNMASNEIIV